jgi:cytochrome oxidase Cu insertion factor (SCO1/SenC/PrrC family)
MISRLIPIPFLFLAGCGLAAGPQPAPAPEPPDLDFPVGSFRLTERGGRTVTDADLRGKVWVASFIFTRCNGPCPQVTSTMRRLQSELADELRAGGLKLVTFTVDPKHDDLRKLREYADGRGAHPDHWLFLTGDEATIHTLLREQFKLPASRRTGPNVEPGAEFDHSPRLVVVDKEGVIRATYPGIRDDSFEDADATFEADLARLRQKARELLR